MVLQWILGKKVERDFLFEQIMTGQGRMILTKRGRVRLGIRRKFFA